MGVVELGLCCLKVVYVEGDVLEYEIYVVMDVDE